MRRRVASKGGVYRNIYEELSLRALSRKMLLWVHVSARTFGLCVFVRLCVYPHAYDETWQRRLECSLGTRESPTRPAPLPLLKVFLQEETEAEGKLAATRKELVEIPLTHLLSSHLRLCASLLLPFSSCSVLLYNKNL